MTDINMDVDQIAKLSCVYLFIFFILMSIVYLYYFTSTLNSHPIKII